MTDTNMEVLPANYVPEQKFVSELAAAELTEQVFQKIVEYKTLADKPITSKEEYQKIKDIKNKEIVKVRTKTVSVCEAGRAESNRISQEWLNVQKKYVAIVKETEDPINARLEEWEAQEAAKLKAEEAEKKLPMRKTILANIGVTVDDAQIKDLTDDEFLTFVNTETQKIADAKALAEAEEKRKKDEEENRKRIEQETLAREKRNIRVYKLTVLGFKDNASEKKYVCTIGSYVSEIPYEYLDGSDEVFHSMIQVLETEIHEAYAKKADEDAKALANKKIVEANAEAERIKLEAENKAKAEADRLKLEAENKAKAEAEKKRQEEEAKKAEEARKAALPDKQKLLDFVNSMAIRLPLPDVKTEQAKKIADYAKQLISLTQQKLTEQINKL